MTLEIGFYLNEKEMKEDDILDKMAASIQDTLKGFEYYIDYGSDGITTSIEIDEDNREEQFQYIKDLIDVGTSFCYNEK